MHLSPELLSSVRADDLSSFRATIHAHGLYHTQQFVLRLSPVNHRILASAKPGITSNKELGYEGAQAMSTYLHETVHWWQHIGSTYGLILSLNYPVQTHATHNDLRQLANNAGFKKSLLQQSIALNRRRPTGFGTDAGRANTIVNNHFDLLAFRAFTLGPEAAKDVVEQNLFEAVGHAFHMTYGHTLNILASTVDRDYSVLPDPRAWSDGFRKLAEDKIEGYYYGSPVGLWPIGSYEIFEGQARFSQIQYLSFACGHRWGWDEFRSVGMLRGVYVRAFEEFLRLTENEWPPGVDHPLVGLFLLICDLAINPVRGFPVTVDPDYKTFIHDVHPGARFCIFCRLIARELPEMTKAITQYSRDEYGDVAYKLCEVAKEASPLLMAKVFAKWFAPGGPFAGLRREYDSYAFENMNLVVRHLFAHFLAFQEDKSHHPEFFCWPGAYMAGKKLSERSMVLFEKHSALFIDKEDDDSVFPRLQQGRVEATVQKVFDDFYANTVVYDLVNQWISSDGPFRYDLGWLAASASDEDASAYMRRQFKTIFGFDPEDAEILS